MSYVSLLLLGLMDNIRGPFYPDVLKDLSLSSTKGSLFFAMASFAALGGNVLGSFLLLKVTAHGLMNYSVMGLGAGFLLIGKSTTFPLLMLSCVFFGIHFGMLNVSQNVVVQRNASPLYRRRIFNGLHAMYGLAALLAPIFATGFFKLGWSWPESFGVVGSLAFIVGGFFLAKAWKWGQAAPQNAQELRSKKEIFSPVKAMLLASSLAFYMVSELSLSTRVVLWTREVFAFSVEHANFYMALFCGGLFITRLTLTFVSLSRFSNVSILVTSGLVSIVFYVTGLLVHPFWAVLSGLSMGPFFPVVLDEMSRRFGLKASQVIGWGITVGSMGIVAMHFTLGVLTDHFGVDHALWLGPVSMLLALTALLLSRSEKIKV